MAEHCVSALLQEREERQYRAYITDALMVIAENTANFAGGRVMSGRWAENSEPEDPRDGDEIVMDIIGRSGLTYAGGETVGA